MLVYRNYQPTLYIPCRMQITNLNAEFKFLAIHTVKILEVGTLLILYRTCNVTGHHRHPKLLLRAGYRALSLKWTSHVVMCFHRRVWYHVLSLHYACIRSSGITSSPRLPLCQILFLLRPPLLSQPMEKIAYSLNHSLTQLI